MATIETTQPRRVMLGRNRLRIDPNDGSSGVEFRIEKGAVESRSIGKRAQRGTVTEGQWNQLMPEQVASHVLADTVVGHWLFRILGIRSLIRACILHADLKSNC